MCRCLVIIFAPILFALFRLRIDAVQVSPVGKAAKPAPEKAQRLVRTAVYGMVLSGDDSWLVTGGDDGTARMWSVATGKLVQAYGRHEKGGISAVALSTDLKLVATGGNDETARLWDAQTGKEVHVFKGHKSRVNGVALSHNGKWLATCGDDGKARIWDLTTKEEVQVLHHQFSKTVGPTVGRLAFSPDDKWLVTAARDHTRIWNVATGKLEKDHNSFFGVSRDSKWLITAMDPERKWIITAFGKGGSGYEDVVAQPYSLDAARSKRSVYMLASSGEGKWILGERETIETEGAFQGVAYLVDFATYKDIRSFRIPVEKGRASDVTEMVLSVDGRKLFTASWDGKARLWDVETGRVIRVFDEPAGKKP
jgi:WD40 repeat protein